MIEFVVVLSDVINIEIFIKCDGDEYVINGCKWYISGVMNENCKIMVVMGKIDFDVFCY